jgi:hypothetical protein
MAGYRTFFPANWISFFFLLFYALQFKIHSETASRFLIISLCNPIKMYSHVFYSFKLCINLLLITSNWWLIFYLFSHTFLQSFSSHSFLLKFDTFWSIKVNYLYIKKSNLLAAWNPRSLSLVLLIHLVLVLVISSLMISHLLSLSFVFLLLCVHIYI